MPDSLKHHFLVSIPDHRGSYFNDTLTYVCEHNKSGAWGLVINQPSRTRLNDILKQSGISFANARDTQILYGGPVQEDRGFLLHTDDYRHRNGVCVGDGVCLTEAPDVLNDIASGLGPRHFILAFGYAGWGPGQLESECKEYFWLTCPANPKIIFETPCEQRLKAVLIELKLDYDLLVSRVGYS